MKNQWRVYAGFLLILVVVVFAILNNKAVPVNFLFATIKAPLILVIIGSAIIGALIVSLVSTGTLWHQKKTIKTLQKDLDAHQQQFDEKVQAEVAKQTVSTPTLPPIDEREKIE